MERDLDQLLLSPKETKALEALILEGIQRERAQKAKKPTFPIDNICFGKQLSFIKDPAKRKTACNSRRSGKTFACAVDLIDTALQFDGANCLYITLSRLNAKRIIWKQLCELCHDYKLGAEINHTELSIKINNSHIYIAGAKDEAEIEKFRGIALKKVYIDEAQSFRSYLHYLIDDILTPSLLDYDGTLILIGTPSAQKAGTFFEACHRGKGFRNYIHHHWTIFDNPHIERKSGKPVATLIKEELERKGITENEPSVRREIFGEWVEDLNSVVYKFSYDKNTYEELPRLEGWRYVMGIDLGFDDADAICVWAFHRESPNIYLVEDWQQSKLSVSDLASVIKKLDKLYPHARKVIDTGGLGKKITEELLQRHQIHLEPADKTQKLSFIELMNDDFRRGIIKVKPSSPIIEDWRLLQWDLDEEKPVEDSRFDNHRPDAALYSWREARHFTFKEEVKKAPIDMEKGIVQYWERLGRDIATKKRQSKNLFE